MERPLQTLQEKFLHDLHENKSPVAVFLVNGIRLQGHIDFFDNYVIGVRSTVTQLVYKHSISTIAPVENESLKPHQEMRKTAQPSVVVRTKPSRWLA